MPGPLGVDSSFRAINAEDPGSAEHPGSMCSFQNKRKFRCVAAAERAAPAVARFAVISSLLRTLRAPAAPSRGTAVPYVCSFGCYHPRNCRHIAGLELHLQVADPGVHRQLRHQPRRHPGVPDRAGASREATRSPRRPRPHPGRADGHLRRIHDHRWRNLPVRPRPAALTRSRAAGGMQLTGHEAAAVALNEVSTKSAKFRWTGMSPLAVNALATCCSEAMTAGVMGTASEAESAAACSMTGSGSPLALAQTAAHADRCVLAHRCACAISDR